MTACESLIVTFDNVDPDTLHRLVPLLAPTTHEFASATVQPKRLVAEIIRFPGPRGDCFAVLLSTACSADLLHQQCWLAFCNDVDRCDAFRALGVPMIEAEIPTHTLKKRLTVIANHYPHGQLALTWSPLLTIGGIDFGASGGAGSRAAGPDLAVAFNQYVPRPDLTHPGFEIVGSACTWTRTLRRLDHSTKNLTITFEEALFPDLNSLWADSSRRSRRPTQVLTTRFSDPQPDLHGGDSKTRATASAAAPLARVHRSRQTVKLVKPKTIGAPDYRFEEMELLGFRIGLPPPTTETAALFAALVRPLNFHLHPSSPTRSIEDFEYRIATRSIIVELIRYGKMKYADDAGPLSKNTYMSQHELLVRLLVGRVDQDGSQARGAATYVQSIFVDNPTSKEVGREMQGYPKLLGAFCQTAADGSLRALPHNGVLDDGSLAPLDSISTVSLATRIPEPDLKGRRVLELSYSVAQLDDDFVALDDALIGGIDDVVGFPWRHGDFDDPAFRRSFARDVVSDGLRRSRSVQAIPVQPIGNEPQTWLTGTYALTNIRFQQPSGIATLRFHAANGAAQKARGWDQLCDLFAALSGTCEVNLPSGSWYRVRCDMDLSIDDGLAWD